jgi:hypothetical protein
MIGSKEKAAARDRAWRAARSGRLACSTVCNKCGRPGVIQGHHHRGYSPANALDVVWLCILCHGREHGVRRAGFGGGRPPTHPRRILFAHSDKFLAAVDAWRAAQPGISPNRSDAIRYLVERGIKATETARSPRKARRK